MAWLFQVVLLGLLRKIFAQNSFGALLTCPARIYSASYFKRPAECSNIDLEKINLKEEKEDSGAEAPRSYPVEGHLQTIMCQFKWTNRQGMINWAQKQIKNRQKVFLRFTSPIYVLTNSSFTCQKSKRMQTWVWVKSSHNNMLLYPHNFVILSFSTFVIITKNLGEAKGECETSSNNGSSPNTEECSLTWQDVHSFMEDVTKDLGDLEWRRVCLQLDYGVSDFIDQPHNAVPDTLYYWKFLRLFLAKKLFSHGKDTSKDLIHYRCCDKNGETPSKKSRLMSNYFVILIIAVILWFYSPLLVIYCPSSKIVPSMSYPQGLAPEDFHPSFKSPKRFGTFLKCVFCFYMKKNQEGKARIRRAVFFICLSLISHRLLPIPGSPYFTYTLPIFVIFLVALMIPDFFSVYLKQDFPKRFLNLWQYPDGVFRATSKVEYQLLAHCMKERIFLTADSRFWSMLWENRLNLLSYSKPQNYTSPVDYMRWIVLSLPGFFSFLLLLVINFAYYFIPAFYFYKELIAAIVRGLRSWVSKKPNSFLVVALGVVYGAVLVLMVWYLMVTMFFWCYLIAEVTMFTYFCIIIVPSMAFEYFLLVGAVGFFFYQTANDLRENYDHLRDQVLELLQTPASLDKAFLKSSKPNTVKRVQQPDGSSQVAIQKSSSSIIILHCEDDISYLSRHLLDACIESCDPLRRLVGFHLLIAFLMVFYILVAMWKKNIYHKETEVSSIFTIAQSTTTYFFPNLLQFLAHRSHFSNHNALRKHLVTNAIVEYANRI